MFVTRFWSKLVICHKVVTMFVTKFWFNYWLLVTRLSHSLSQCFSSIIGYLPQSYHNVCHTVLVQLLVIWHTVVTMFVTRFWFNYWSFATRLPQCLSQGFGSIIGYLPQDCHNVCHKVLRLVVDYLPQSCHKVTTMFVTFVLVHPFMWC